LTENASLRFPDAHCRITDFVIDLWGISKAASQAKDAAEAKAKAEAETRAEEAKKKAEEEAAAAKKLADQEAAARKKAEEAEAARKKAEVLAEAARAGKAGVLCGVGGVLWSSSGRWGRAYAAVCDSFCFCLSLCACA
jgi:hypothetical protein